jgi:hypothetical protein
MKMCRNISLLHFNKSKENLGPSVLAFNLENSLFNISTFVSRVLSSAENVS